MDILAPLSGKIVGVSIQVGDTINEDDEAFVVEAMKMETPVYSPGDGTIKEIKVKEGDDVEMDDVLAVIG